MPDNNTSLEAFRKKHGQAAYNTLIKSVEGMKKPAAGVADNRSLSQMASRMLAKPAADKLAAASRVPRVRGSSDVPLNEEGLQQADNIARQFATKGGLDAILTSPLQRARHTAVAISKYTGAPLQVTEKAMPWRLGIFEGQPVDNVKTMLAKLALDHPDEKVPGMSPHSTMPGESFNEFKQRHIGELLAPLMHAHAQEPIGKIGVVEHLRDILAAKSWIEHGARKDLHFDHHDINYESRTSNEERPSSVFRIHPDGDKWKFEDVDMEKPEPLEAGIYLIRHGETDWNSNGQRTS